MTHPTLDELLALLDGDAAAATAAHVADCPACQSLLDKTCDLRRRLHALPQLEPRAGGWERLQARRRSDHRTRVWARCGWAAAAAMALFTATVAVRGGVEAWNEAKLQRQVQLLVAESQRLEREVRSGEANERVQSGRTAYAIADLEGRIDALDARLAAARRERRPTSEIVELWQQRVALLDDLASVRATRVAYVGI